MRKIKGGRVRINRHIYAPSAESSLPYDGRLDGLWYAFGLYERDTSFVCLWGTRQMYFSKNIENEPNGPEVIDGKMPWTWWHEVKDARR